MPIEGVICDATGEKVLTADCLRCSLEHPDRCTNDTIVLAGALRNRKFTSLSMSEVTTDFIRKTLLEKMLDYYVTPANAYYAVRGTWVHRGQQVTYLSDKFGKTLREKRLYIPELNLGGQVDMYYADYNRLIDYKSASRMPEEPHPNHIRQLNGYVELLRRNDYEVDNAYLTYLTYSSHKRIPVDIWPREKTQAMLKELVDFFRECLEKREVPPRDFCAGPNRWYLCKYCAFRDACKEHYDWWKVDERLSEEVQGEGR